jgi:hypothetical protein
MQYTMSRHWGEPPRVGGIPHQRQGGVGHVCKGIPLEFIGKMNRDLMRAVWRRRRELLVTPAVIQQPFHEYVGTEAEGA